MKCTTNFDCALTQYCDTDKRVCMTNGTNTKVCYRSEECPLGGFCKKPGATMLPNCATCPVAGKPHSDQDMLDIHNCHCGAAKYCNNCDETKAACLDCVTGYVKSGSLCVKICNDNSVAETECKCGNNTCQKGQKCSVEATEYQCLDVVYDCAVDETCKTCDTNTKKCTECIDGYTGTLDGKCAIKNTCLTGITAVANCEKCSAADELECEKCEETYELKDKKCNQIACDVLFPNCRYCSGDRKSCSLCNDGYTAVDGVCVESVAECTNDFDCGDDASNKYCKITTKKCEQYTVSSAVCYRTAECKTDGEYCKTPGSTQVAQCGKCSETATGINYKTCKCGTAAFCKFCTDDRKACASCVTGYELNETKVCQKSCVADEVLASACACHGFQCAAGSTCTASGCIGSGVTDSCQIGPSKVDKCIKCDSTDVKLCVNCEQGYTVDTTSNTCVKASDCLSGATLIENCEECETSAPTKCSKCKNTYFLLDGVCEQETCLIGPDAVEHCTACSPLDRMQCITCDGDLVLHQNTCVRREGTFCNNDLDCKATEYCTVQSECVAFEADASVCYRSEECKSNNKMCGKPGSTQKGSCGGCAKDSYGMIDRKTCKCGDAKYCALCTAAGTACEKCIRNYGNVDGECVANCQFDVQLTGSCPCGESVCRSGQFCQLNPDKTATCVSTPTEDDCLSGATVTPHCTACDANNKLVCAACADGYELGNDKNCHQRDDCVYGSKKVDNCKSCSSTDKYACDKCKDGFDLADGKCTAAARSNNQTGVIIGSVVAAVVVIVVAIVVAVILIRKRKVNGNVAQDPKSRKRDTPVPDEVHIPI